MAASGAPIMAGSSSIHGKVLEQPAEASSTAKDRIRARSYPVHEAGGAFWVYLGPGEAPLFPAYPALQGVPSLSLHHPLVRRLQLDAGERGQHRSRPHLLSPPA